MFEAYVDKFSSSHLSHLYNFDAFMQNMIMIEEHNYKAMDSAGAHRLGIN